MDFDLKIDLPELLRIALDYFRTYTSFLIGVSVTYLVLAVIPNTYLFLFPPESETIGQSLMSVGLSLLQMLLTLGVTKISLQLIDNAPTHVGELFSPLGKLLDYFLAYLIYVFIVAIGLAMLVFPGVYLAVRLQFYTFVIIDEDLNFWEALQRSFELTEEWTWSLFVWGLIYLIINILGTLFFFVGVIFTFPLTQMANALIYRGLQRDSEYLPDGYDQERLDLLSQKQ